MPYRIRVAVLYLLGFFVDLINMFSTGVAFPAIGRALHASLAELAWVSNGYILGLTVVLPLSAWLMQRVDARRIMLLSLALFLLATLAAGTAARIETLIGWRIVQGLGGGLLIPVGQTLAYRLYPRHERARLSAAIMLVGLLAPALSPALGGLIADQFSWRGIFFASLPPALLALILAACWLRPTPPPAERTPLDWHGLLTFSAAVALLLLGLTGLAEHSMRWQPWALVAAGALLLMKGIHHSRRHPHPLLAPVLLHDPLLRMAMLMYQAIPGLFMGVNLLAMLFLQAQLLMTAAQAGAMMVPWALASFVAILTTGKLFNTLGPRPLLVAGCLAQGAGMLLLAQITGTGQETWLLAAFMLMGLGGSLCSSTAQSSAFLTIPDSRLAAASALWNINRQLSFCLGVTLVSMLFGVLQQHMDLLRASHGCFYLVAASTLLPLAGVLRLDNRGIVRRIALSKES